MAIQTHVKACSLCGALSLGRTLLNKGNREWYLLCCYFPSRMICAFLWFWSSLFSLLTDNFISADFLLHLQRQANARHVTNNEDGESEHQTAAVWL